MLKLLISFVLVTTLVADYQYNNGPQSDIEFSPVPEAWWITDSSYDNSYSTGKTIPFPQCLLSNNQGSRNRQSYNNGRMNNGPRNGQNYGSGNGQNYGSGNGQNYGSGNGQNYGSGNGQNYGSGNGQNYGPGNGQNYGSGNQAGTLKLTNNIKNALACDFNGTDANSFYKFLNKFKVPEQFCSQYENINCYGKTSYRTANGICNNIRYPYQGSSQTSYDRYLSAQYDDGVSKPRRKSVVSGLLPSCRRVSLALGNKPIFDRSFNNFFVIFGQVIGHDMSLATPVTDPYSTSVSSCTCDSKNDWNRCTVIDIPADDPYLAGQKCMAFPATAQSFKDQLCSLGVKEQLNSNTHLLDLSILYGSTLETALALRGHRGKMKSTRFKWSRFESPPAQQAEKSCTDHHRKRHCFAGGDSRLMITSLFTGIEVIFLRFHNFLARTFAKLYPEWSSDLIYEEARRVNGALFQQLIYDWWLPLFFGYDGFAKYVGVTPVPSSYNENLPPIVFNEAAAAALRCHTLVRDLFSRCTYDGKRIDQLWLVDVVHRAKPAYDIENNGLDSILCGSFYDYGFAHDGNFAAQIQNRLFESVGQYGQYWRNDLISINICRGREHGISSYNAYRQYCGINKAYYFEDFGDTINYDGIQTLKKLYKSPDDVDLFVGLNLEDELPGALIGPTSSCLLGKQFQRLRDGDRLFYTNENVFTPSQLERIKKFSIHCFICLTVDIRSVAYNPFRPPNEYDNPLQDCSTCQPLDLTNWTPAENSEYQSDGAPPNGGAGGLGSDVKIIKAKAGPVGQLRESSQKTGGSKDEKVLTTA